MTMYCPAWFWIDRTTAARGLALEVEIVSFTLVPGFNASVERVRFQPTRIIIDGLEINSDSHCSACPLSFVRVKLSRGWGFE